MDIKNEKESKIMLKLFLSTLYISSCTFGGGFVIVTFMKRKFVDELHWLENDEMLDLIALSQSCPGAIAVNAATLVGWHLNGVKGVIVAVTGTIIPPMFILTVISFFYSAFASNVVIALILKGMQAGVAAVIIDVVCNLGKDVLKVPSKSNIAVMVLAFVATFVFEINVIYIILATIVFSIVSNIIRRKRGGKIV